MGDIEPAGAESLSPAALQTDLLAEFLNEVDPNLGGDGDYEKAASRYAISAGHAQPTEDFASGAAFLPELDQMDRLIHRELVLARGVASDDTTCTLYVLCASPLQMAQQGQSDEAAPVIYVGSHKHAWVTTRCDAGTSAAVLPRFARLVQTHMVARAGRLAGSPSLAYRLSFSLLSAPPASLEDDPATLPGRQHPDTAADADSAVAAPAGGTDRVSWDFPSLARRRLLPFVRRLREVVNVSVDSQVLHRAAAPPPTAPSLPAPLAAAALLTGSDCTLTARAARRCCTTRVCPRPSLASRRAPPRALRPVRRPAAAAAAMVLEKAPAVTTAMAEALAQQALTTI